MPMEPSAETDALQPGATHHGAGLAQDGPPILHNARRLAHRHRRLEADDALQARTAIVAALLCAQAAATPRLHRLEPGPSASQQAAVYREA